MASSVIKKQYVTDKTAQSGIEVPANSAYTAEFSVAKSGYVPIGIVEIYKSGASHGTVAISGFGLRTGGNAFVSLANPTGTTRTVSVTVTVLYERS